MSQPSRRSLLSLHPPAARTLRRLALGAPALLLAISVTHSPVAAAARTYYVDCAGSDTNAGTSPSAPWQSLSKANAATLYPGDSLLLKRGCTWTGPLTAKWSGTSTAPITIGAYGTGNQPRIQNAHEDVAITGSWLTISDLYTRADPTGYDSGCDNAPSGWRVGFRFMNGASYNTVRNSTAYGLYIGILIGSGTSHNKVLNNTLPNNNMKDPDTSSDAGAVGVSVMGDDNVVAYNSISGSDVCSRFYGRDGAAVEIYGGERNSIHHNRAFENANFTELGNSRSANNTYAYNQITSTLTSANFLVTRGPNQTNGPVYGTKVYNNSVYLTGSSSYAIQCFGCSGSVLSFHDNIVWAEDRIGYADANFDEGNNIYWRSDGAPKIYFNISSSSRKADPMWVNRSAGNLALQSGSPAIDKATRDALNLGYTTDLVGTTVPQGAAPDIGVEEYTTSITSPTPAPSSSGTTYVSDGFARTVTNGWGSAGTGGAYTVMATAANYDVGSDLGTMALAPGQTRASYLWNVSARDVDTTVKMRTNTAASGNGNFGYVVARSTSNGASEYRLKVHVLATGSVVVQATKVIGGSESSIGSAVTTGISYKPGTDLWVHGQVVGTGPTTLRIKVWPAGQSEPSTWQYVATDSTSSLSTAGAAGLRAYVASNSTTSTTTFGFSSWSVVAP